MKRFVISGLLFLLLFSFVVAQEPQVPSVGSEQDAKDIQEAIDKLPISETGEIDYDKFKPFRTKADERIEKINKYVGPITKVLWGVELSLSWVFIFSFVLWILLIELIVMPFSEIFNFNILGSLFGAGIIATLAMQGFGKNFVIWIESLVTQWYIGAMVLIFGAIFAVAYSIIMKHLGVSVKAAKEKVAADQTKMDRKILRTEAWLIRKGWKD
ncbi:MAG: hypothetical protein ABIF18_04240 [archaeon]